MRLAVATIPVLRAILEIDGFTEAEFGTLLEESVMTPAAMQDIRSGARQSIKHFVSVGTLQINSMRDAFDREGLL